MAAKGTDEDGRFSSEERAAMKQRGAELRRSRTAKGAEKQEAEARALAEAIAGMEGEDRELAELVERAVTSAAPQLLKKTWYGFPAWHAGDGKAIVFFKPAAKFKDRYATLGFNDMAQLDDGDMWAKEFALLHASDEVERRVADLVRRAAG